MNKHITLLVSLKPSKPQKDINELIIFDLVNPITDVMNLKPISKQNCIKAFVQVKSKQMADIVVNKLHGQNLDIGRIQAFISHKKYIHYEMNLKEVLKACRQNTKTRLSNFKDGKKNQFISAFNGKINWDAVDDMKVETESFRKEDRFCRNIDDVLNKSNPTIGYLSEDSISEIEHGMLQNSAFIENNDNLIENLNKLEDKSSERVIQVIHQNLIELDQLRVFTTFKRFGNIVNLTFNYNRVFWSVEYESSNQARKAIRAIEDDEVGGYRIFGKHRQPIKRKKSSNSYINDTKLQKLIDCVKKQSLSSLQVAFNDVKISIGMVCELISRTHSPIELRRCFDDKSGLYYYEANFEFLYQAAEVLNDFAKMKNVVKWSFVDIKK